MPVDAESAKAVLDTLHRLTGALDAGNWDLWETCFAPTAYVDYSQAGGTAGPPSEVRQMEDGLVALDLIRHLVTNAQMEERADGSLQGHALFMCASRGEPQAAAALVGGRYDFIARQTSELWLFEHLTAAIEWWV